MIIIRNASESKLININGVKNLAPDEYTEIKEEELTPGVRALIAQGTLVLSKKEVVKNESLDILKEIDKKKEAVKEEAVKEEPEAEETEEKVEEAVEDKPVKKTTTRGKTKKAE